MLPRLPTETLSKDAAASKVDRLLPFPIATSSLAFLRSDDLSASARRHLGVRVIAVLGICLSRFDLFQEQHKAQRDGELCDVAARGCGL